MTIDLSMAPGGAERYNHHIDRWLKKGLTAIYYWKDSGSIWLPLTSSANAMSNWNEAEPIYKDLPVAEEEEEHFNALGQVTTSVGTEDYESSRSDGSTASYYELPPNATELQHLISHRNLNAQIGEIFRACYRYGMASHSDQLRDAKKILFYAKAEVQRLENQK